VNILLLLAHEIAEYDDLRMLTDLGHDVFSIGAYTNPARPDLRMEFGGRGLRPPLPNVTYHPELEALCHEQRVKHEGQPTDFGIVDWAKADLHPDLIEWADVIIAHHFVDTWLGGQWERIRHKRVIWRTCGQSNPRLEHGMRPLHDDGLQIVRYSPKEREAFEALGVFAGEDAMIRFGKYPADYGPWIGDDLAVGNLTQNMDIRGEHCGYPFWQIATADLPTKPAGTGSERIGGLGELSYEGMLDYLRHIRVFLYTGTQPASYTLGLMEAMLTGTPIVSIGPEGLWLPGLFEGHELATDWRDDPAEARKLLAWYVSANPQQVAGASYITRAEAISLFDVATVGQQWQAFLGAPVAAKVAA
jgi:hypothetical protein